MKDMGSREFQLNYQRLTEPVRVISKSVGGRVIGFFYPGEVDPKVGEQGTLDMPWKTVSEARKEEDLD